MRGDTRERRRPERCRRRFGSSVQIPVTAAGPVAARSVAGGWPRSALGRDASDDVAEAGERHSPAS